MILVSCHADLDQVPTDPDLFTEIDVFKDTDSAKGALAKIYASLAITGQIGPAGNPDCDDRYSVGPASECLESIAH